jgi:hypothetical protein
VKAKAGELTAAPGDWAAFDRTAPGRKVLAEAFPASRDSLGDAENEWVYTAVLGQRASPAPAVPGGALPGRTDWRAIEKTVLALPALDTSESRFKKARDPLFTSAHDDAKSAIAAHLEAGRYDLAFGAARKHAVEWSATATVLGTSEVQKLDKLREHCESFAKLYDVSAKPADPAELAPPPRAKPD